jgi:high-affinity Fe2+/Pb2+ permease
MTIALAIPAWLFYSIKPGTPLWYGCWLLTSAGTTAWFGPLFSAYQELAPSHTRSTMVAFALLTLNLLGVGPGPLITGMIGDRRNLTEGLLISVIITVLAFIPFAMAARSESARLESSS